MDDTFKIGEIVVCINAKRRWYKLGGLKENEMYTIIGFNPYDGGLVLNEVKSRWSGYNAYKIDRFRKVDYSFAENILEAIEPQKEEVEIEIQLRKFELTFLN